MNSSMFRVLYVLTFVLSALRGVNADPVDGSTFTMTIRVTPVIAYWNGSGAYYGVGDTIFSGTGTVATTPPAAIQNNGPLTPAPSGAVGNDLFIKAESGNYAPLPGVRQLIANLEGSVTAAASPTGGLADIASRVLEIASAQTVPLYMYVWSMRYTFSLEGVEFPPGTRPSVQVNSSIHYYPSLFPGHDPATDTIPPGPYWYDLPSYGTPLVVSGADPCADGNRYNFKLYYEIVGDTFRTLPFDGTAMRFRILFQESSPVFGLQICPLDLFPQGFFGFVLNLVTQDKMGAKDADMILDKGDSLRVLVEEANKTVDEKVHQAAVDDIDQELASLEDMVGDLHRQRKLAYGDYQELMVWIEEAREEFDKATR